MVKEDQAYPYLQQPMRQDLWRAYCWKDISIRKRKDEEAYVFIVATSENVSQHISCGKCPYVGLKILKDLYESHLAFVGNSITIEALQSRGER